MDTPVQDPSFAPYLVGMRQRAEQSTLRREAERRRLLAQAAVAAGLLRECFGASQVWVFGSLLRPGGFDEASDIDLAVSGVIPERFFAAWAAATQVLDRPLDLVDLDDCQAGLRAAILKEGQAL